MAIPDNYIDKFTKDGESRMISPAAEQVRVDNEHYEGDNLDDVLGEIDEKVSQAGTGNYTKPSTGIPKSDMDSAVQTSLGKADSAVQGIQINGGFILPKVHNNVDIFVPSRTSQLQNDSGYITEDDLPEGVECDTQMSSTSVKPVQNKVIKAYIDNLIAGLIDGAPAALDTLKELAVALSNNQDAVAALTNLINSKANADEVVKSISVNGQSQSKDTNGNVNIPSVDGADGVTPHIGSNGNWFIGTTDTEVKARGVDGISVSDPADIEVVHNLDDEKSENFDPTSQVAVLGADMGKELADMIDAISGGFAASVKVINGKNTLVFDSLTTPAIVASVQSLNFGEVEYGKSKSLTFTVRGRWLNNGISINSGSAKVVCSPASTSGGNATIITATYTPTSDDETLSTNIVLSSTGAESITIAVGGEGVEEVVPVITLSPSTVNIGTASGTSASGTINVKGSNLEGDITLAVSGSGLSLSAATVTKADAEAAEGKDITVIFDGSADVIGTITASTTGGSDATATVNGNVVTPFASNAQFNIGGLRYIVQSDRSKVAVQQNANSKPTGAVTIPAYVNDYGITPVIGGSSPGEGASYKVQTINTSAFDENGNITSVDIQGQVTAIGNIAFRKCSALTSINIPASVVTLGEFSLQQTALKTVHIYAGNTMTIKSAAFNGFYGATQGNTDCHVYLHADTLPVIDPNAEYAPFPNFYGTLHLKAGVQLSGKWAEKCADATVVNDL